MKYHQKLYNKNGIQVALFPLESFIITQRDDETFSHDPTKYLASDYQSFTYTTEHSGYVNNFAPYYAPADMVCVGMDKVNASILWRSERKVILPNGNTDYLLILFYHDNNVPNSMYTIGERCMQGEIIGHTGTYGDGGSGVANHVHIETGYGENWSKVYAQPNYGHINLEYALHNYDACYGNDIIDNGINAYPDRYPWILFDENKSNKKHKNFKWVLYARHLRNKNN